MMQSVNEGRTTELKKVIHQRLLDSLDLAQASRLSREELLSQSSKRVAVLVEEEGGSLGTEDRALLVSELLNDIFGLGPLEPLMADPAVSDILVNGPDHVWLERFGRLEKIDVAFRDASHLMQVINRIVRTSGRRIDESSPMVDTRLPDGSRVNAVIPPLALDGPQLSIRRFPEDLFTLDRIIKMGCVAPSMAQFLTQAVISRANIVISGGAGAGKTTTLNALSAFIPESERVITIEDAAELRLQGDHVVRLESRPPNIEGAGEIDARTLVRNSLRMRPDRILIGECRGSEAFEMLQAMNTGHEGSMTTVHANSTNDAMSRIENMLAMTGLEIPVSALREYLNSAIDLVLQMDRIPGGRRVFSSISQVEGVQDGKIQLKEIYRFVRKGVDEKGFAFGTFEATGVESRLLERIRTSGGEIDDSLFASGTLCEIRGAPESIQGDHDS